jgi:membrane protein DedA with SNARE-associated domain
MPDHESERTRRLSLEQKYAAIAIVVVGGFVLAHVLGAFSGVNNTVDDGINRLAGAGSIGIFLIALIANLSILVQIPYTLPLLSAALSGASLQSIMMLGLASGLGAGIGSVASYKVAEALVARSPRVPQGRLFRWVARSVEDSPRLTSTTIFLVATSPLPDGAVVIPLAVVRYGMRRLAVPLFLGKLVHNIVLALLFYAFASWSADHVSQKASTELAVLVALLFMVLVAYNAEKARTAEQRDDAEPRTDAGPRDGAEPRDDAGRRNEAAPRGGAAPRDGFAEPPV